MSTLAGFELAFDLPEDAAEAAALSTLFTMCCLDLAAEDLENDDISIGSFINNPFAVISEFEPRTNKALFRLLLTENFLYPLEAFDETVPDRYNHISLNIVVPRTREMLAATSAKVAAQFDLFAQSYDSTDPVEVKAAFEVQVVSDAIHSLDPYAKREAQHIIVFKENDTLVYKFPDLRLTRASVVQFLQERVEPHDLGLPNYFYRICN